MNITKSDPPPSKKFATDVPWDEIVAALDAEPGTWFLIGEFSPGVPSHIRAGRYRAFLTGMTDGLDPHTYVEDTYEVTTRTSATVTSTGSKRVDVWIRRRK